MPPHSPTLYQPQEGLVGYSQDASTVERGLLLSFEHAPQEDEHGQDEFYLGFDSDEEMEGGLVDVNTLLAGNEGGSSSSSSSSKRKAEEEAGEEEGGKTEGNGKERGGEKVEEGGGPVVILTKAGKPRKKKGKAIVACEVS